MKELKFEERPAASNNDDVIIVGWRLNKQS